MNKELGYGKYVLHSNITYGPYEKGYSAVYTQKGDKASKKYYVKVSADLKVSQSVEKLSQVITVLNEVAPKCDRVPKIIINSHEGSRKFLVMEHIPHTISSYLYRTKKTREEKDLAIVDIGRQILDCMKKVHACKYIIDDVTPSSFRLTNDGKLYLTDFSTLYKYVEILRIPLPTERHESQRARLFSGDFYFAPSCKHDKLSTSRKHDIEGLAYTLLYLLTDGNYSWFMENFEHHYEHGHRIIK